MSKVKSAVKFVKDNGSILSLGLLALGIGTLSCAMYDLGRKDEKTLNNAVLALACATDKTFGDHLSDCLKNIEKDFDLKL